jgi:hypothetical protein
LDEVENGNFIKYHEDYNRISQEEPMAEAPMIAEAIPDMDMYVGLEMNEMDMNNINEG